MISISDLLKKVRKVEIKTKGITRDTFAGQYHSVFKGRGMSFSEVRAYQYGDEVRTIDWNVTARVGEPHIKVFEEERELTVILLVDVSASMFFGTQQRSKKELMIEIAAIIAFSAMQNNDKVGLLMFDDKVVKYLPPQKGKSHTLQIIRELIHHQEEHTTSNLNAALTYVSNINKRRSIVFVLSDFVVSNYEIALSIAASKHDVIGINVFDPREKSLVDVGLIRVIDPESKTKTWVDTSDPKVRNYYSTQFDNRVSTFISTFAKTKSDTILHETTEETYLVLKKYFKRRRAKR